MGVGITVEQLNAFYGKTQALFDINVTVEQGETVAIIGANGAGKTTILNTISGVTPAAGGEILFLQEPVACLSPDQIVKLGISQVPEGRQMFKPLSVEDNLRLGAWTQPAPSIEASLAMIRDFSEVPNVSPLIELLRPR